MPELTAQHTANPGETITCTTSDGKTVTGKAAVPVATSKVFGFKDDNGDVWIYPESTPTTRQSGERVRRSRPSPVITNLYPFKELFEVSSKIKKGADGFAFTFLEGRYLVGISNTGKRKNNFIAVLQDAGLTQTLVYKGTESQSYPFSQSTQWLGHDWVGTNTTPFYSTIGASLSGFYPFVVSTNTSNSFVSMGTISFTTFVTDPDPEQKAYALSNWNAGNSGLGTTLGDFNFPLLTTNYSVAVSKSILANNYTFSESVIGTATIEAAADVMTITDARNHLLEENQTVTVNSYLTGESQNATATHSLVISTDETSQVVYDFSDSTYEANYAYEEIITYSRGYTLSDFITPLYQIPVGEDDQINQTATDGGTGHYRTKGVNKILAGDSSQLMIYVPWEKKTDFTFSYTREEIDSRTGTFTQDFLNTTWAARGGLIRAGVGQTLNNFTATQNYTLSTVSSAYIRDDAKDVQIAINQSNTFVVEIVGRLTLPSSGSASFILGSNQIYFGDSSNSEYNQVGAIATFIRTYSVAGGSPAGISTGSVTNAQAPSIWTYLATAPVYIVQKEVNDEKSVTVKVWEATITSVTRSDQSVSTSFTAYNPNLVYFLNSGSTAVIDLNGTDAGNPDFALSAYQVTRTNAEAVNGGSRCTSLAAIAFNITSYSVQKHFFFASYQGNYNKTYIVSRANLFALLRRFGTPQTCNLIRKGNTYYVYASTKEFNDNQANKDRDWGVDFIRFDSGNWVRDRGKKETLKKLNGANSSSNYSAPSYYPV